MMELGQKLVELMRIIHFFELFVAVGSFTADSTLLQPTGVCKQYTSHVTFSFTACTFNDV